MEDCHVDTEFLVSHWSLIPKLEARLPIVWTIWTKVFEHSFVIQEVFTLNYVVTLFMGKERDVFTLAINARSKMAPDEISVAFIPSFLHVAKRTVVDFGNSNLNWTWHGGGQ